MNIIASHARFRLLRERVGAPTRLWHRSIPLAAGLADETIPQGPSPSIPDWVPELLNNPGALYARAGRFLGGLLQVVAPLAVVVVILGLSAVADIFFLRRRQALRLCKESRYLRVLPPPEVDRGRAVTLWSAMHGLIRPAWARLIYGQPHLVWEYSAMGAEAEVGIWVPGGVPPGLVEQAVQTAWPGACAEISRAPRLAEGLKTASCEMNLAESECFPLGEGSREDPMEQVLGQLGLLESDEQAIIQILARPATSSRQKRIRAAARKLRRAQSAARNPAAGRVPRIPDPTVDEDIRLIMAKATSVMWEVVVRVAVASPSKENARGRIHGLAGGFEVFAGRNWLVRGRVRGGIAMVSGRRMQRSFALSNCELARMAALPSASAMPSLERSRARTVAPPREAPADGKPLGTADRPGYARKVAIAVPDAAQHIHLIGATGTGKSTLIAQMVLSDAAERRAAVVIDPKGDLIASIIERMPASAVESTCLFDPDDPDVAVGLNVLEGGNPDLVVDQVVSVFKRIYADAWGARSDDIMRCACLTLTQVPGSTLADVGALLTNEEFRKKVLADSGRFASIGDLDLFWQWYEDLGSQKAMNIGPLMNKLRAFLLRGPVRAIVGQAKPKLDVGQLIDSGGLLLVRIPKGTIGEETSRILGAFVVARVWQACMARAHRSLEERPPVGLYVDEMHNYLALPRSFEDMLAEARGYGLGMVLAHQHMGQLTRDVSDALAANARTKVAFAVSPRDAGLLAPHFSPQLSDWDLSNLSAFQGACRPLVHGAQGAAFTFRTDPLAAEIPDRAATVRGRSAENFGVKRRAVDARLKNRIGELGDQWLDESVVESPVALKLDRQPVPVYRGKRP